MQEEWKAVVGAKDFEVSDLGNVRVWRTKDGKHPAMYPRAIEPVPSGDYRRVNINKIMRRIGHLVLEAFVGPRPIGMVCCHGPNGQQDDSLTNVSWGTQSKNLGEDKIRDGTDRSGEKHHYSRYTDEQAQQIVDRHFAGESIALLSKEYGGKYETIWYMVKRKTWKHLRDPAIVTTTPAFDMFAD